LLHSVRNFRPVSPAINPFSKTQASNQGLPLATDQASNHDECLA
jgi:hypothetical protein